MNSPCKVIKCLSHCVRILRNRASHQISMRRYIAHGNPCTSLLNAVRDRDDSCNSSCGSRSYHDDRYQPGRSQSGMDASYERPQQGHMKERYSDERDFEAYQRNEARQLVEAKRRFAKEAEARRSREQQMQLQDASKFSVTSISNSQDIESNRRHIPEDKFKHHKRQLRVIEENKRKWQNRPEPNREINAPGVTYKFEDSLLTAKKKIHHKKSDDDRTAEEYSRKRRASRLKELKIQERIFRKRREGIKLPKVSKSEAAPTEAETKSLARARYEKELQRQEEAPYWHTWTTCPDERRMYKSEDMQMDVDADPDAESTPGYGKTGERHRGLTRPPSFYDGSRRRFQTNSRQQAAQSDNEENFGEWERERAKPRNRSKSTTHSVHPPAYDKHVKPPMPRMPRRMSGMDKQFKMIYELSRNRFAEPGRSKSALSRRTICSIPLMQPQDFQRPQSESATELSNLPLSRIKQTWVSPKQPMNKRSIEMRPSERRLDVFLDRVTDTKEQEENYEQEEEEKLMPKMVPVQQPHYRMTVKSKALKRMRVPVCSFSERLNLRPQLTTHSEYMGYSRDTICDQWEKFKNGLICKPIY